MKLENHTAYLGMKTPLVSFKDKKPTDALTSNKKRMLRFGKKKALFLSIYFITIIIFMVMKLLLSLPQLLATEKKNFTETTLILNMKVFPIFQVTSNCSLTSAMCSHRYVKLPRLSKMACPSRKEHGHFIFLHCRRQRDKILD